MSIVRTLILRAPGTNCNEETAYAFERAGALTDTAHVNELLRRDVRLDDYHILCIPGGFTYGDDISGGKILANELKGGLYDDMRRFVDDGKLVLGICNGLQVLVKAGLLPGGSTPLTLTVNDSGRFECRWTYLKADGESRCIFTRGIDLMYLPVAHGEGKVVTDPDKVDIPLVYCDENGASGAAYPHNPNGSVADIAGICDDTGRIFALMPHPERFIHRTQHPRWTRETLPERGDGLAIFTNAVEWCRTI